MKPFVDARRCSGCGACVSVCPMKGKVIAMKDIHGERKACVLDAGSCDLGRACERVCPTKAFRFVG
jgi:NAD-dependent dihydropyrimidine dehydrogenase PreA subunit